MSERQAPQVVENIENAIETMDPKEALLRLDTQEVTDSSSVKPTITFPKNSELRLSIASIVVSQNQNVSELLWF